MGAGNVSLVKVGQTTEEKKTLLRSAGLAESTINHCVDDPEEYGENGDMLSYPSGSTVDGEHVARSRDFSPNPKFSQTYNPRISSFKGSRPKLKV